MKVWVITREHNEYDQHGEYFEAVFKEKPTLECLASYFKGCDWVNAKDVFDAVEFLEHLRNGGGRRNLEDVWFNMLEVEAL